MRKETAKKRVEVRREGRKKGGRKEEMKEGREKIRERGKKNIRVVDLIHLHFGLTASAVIMFYNDPIQNISPVTPLSFYYAAII